MTFCACGVDAAYVVVSRYKLQKITETIALTLTSKLKAQTQGAKNIEELNLIAYNFESLYSKPSSGFWGFDVKSIEYKEDEKGDVKLKLTVDADITTYYLRFLGIGKITLMSNAYAKGETKEYTMDDFNADNTTKITFNETLTDKSGVDISVVYDGDYFIFGGLNDNNNNIVWTDLGEKTTGTYASEYIGNNISASLISGSSDFDLGKQGTDETGLLKHIKIYKAKGQTGGESSSEITNENESGGNMTPSETLNPPVIKILNSVSLIRKNLY